MPAWNDIWAFMVAWYWLPLALVYTAIIITIVSQNRNPSKSLAYILVLTYLPILGLVIYFFVGRKPVFKNWAFKRKALFEKIKLSGYYESAGGQMEERLQHLEKSIGDMTFPFRYLLCQRQSLISTGNKVTLLNNGEEKFPVLFSALERATKHIHLEYYIFSPDDVGNRVAGILMRKQQEGVAVRLIVDDVGSGKLKNLATRMSKAGIEVRKTLPVAFSSLANSNYRNHRKIVVIDGEVGFVGGMNLDDRYWNNGKHSLFWRDTAVCIEGPAVRLLQIQFLLSWLFSGGPDLLHPGSPLLQDDPVEKGEAVVSFAVSGPSSDAPYIMEAIILAISQAKRSVCISTPYFIPSDQLVTALMIAASRGVIVELILPSKSDSFIVQHASFSFIKPLLERGVKLYLYEKGFLHSKVISIDRKLAFIGTVNMDTRSFFLNFEITSLIYEPGLCKKVETSFEKDRQDSRLVTLEYFRSRHLLMRAIDSLCRLVAPLL